MHFAICLQAELQLGEFAAELQMCFDLLQMPQHGTILAALFALIKDGAVTGMLRFEGGRQQVAVTGAALPVPAEDAAAKAVLPRPPAGMHALLMHGMRVCSWVCARTGRLGARSNVACKL